MPAIGPYIRRETFISVVINVVLSGVAFITIYHNQAAVALWGSGGLVFDGLVQGFMVGLMSVTPPLILTWARFRSGKLEGPTTTLRTIAIGSLISAVGFMGAVFILSWTVATLTGADSLAFLPALLLKAALGGLIAMLATPLALSIVLRRRSAS